MINHDLDRLTTCFEIAIENFFRSTFDLQANESAFQAWFAASLIAEFPDLNMSVQGNRSPESIRRVGHFCTS